MLLMVFKRASIASRSEAAEAPKPPRLRMTQRGPPFVGCPIPPKAPDAPDAPDGDVGMILLSLVAPDFRSLRAQVDPSPRIAYLPT